MEYVLQMHEFYPKLQLYYSEISNRKLLNLKITNWKSLMIG